MAKPVEVTESAKQIAGKLVAETRAQIGQWSAITVNGAHYYDTRIWVEDDKAYIQVKNINPAALAPLLSAMRGKGAVEQVSGGLYQVRVPGRLNSFMLRLMPGKLLPKICQQKTEEEEINIRQKEAKFSFCPVLIFV